MSHEAKFDCVLVYSVIIGNLIRVTLNRRVPRRHLFTLFFFTQKTLECISDSNTFQPYSLMLFSEDIRIESLGTVKGAPVLVLCYAQLQPKLLMTQEYMLQIIALCSQWLSPLIFCSIHKKLYILKFMRLQGWFLPYLSNTIFINQTHCFKLPCFTIGHMYVFLYSVLIQTLAFH